MGKVSFHTYRKEANNMEEKYNPFKCRQSFGEENIEEGGESGDSDCHERALPGGP